jgi:hypothetical protein
VCVGLLGFGQSDGIVLADYTALEGALVLGLGPLGLIAVSYLADYHEQRRATLSR